MDGYITLARRGESEIVEKKSRFIGYAVPVADADEAELFVADVRAIHPDARHVVFAYVCGGNGTPEKKRMSDDGEPQGTGGPPCLDVLEKKGITNTAVAVVRYFGGILLGAPGLVRAYGKAAVAAVEEAGTAQMIPCRTVTVRCDYTLFGKLSKAAEGRGYKTEAPEFGEGVTFTLTVKDAEAEALAAHLRDISAARAEAFVSDEVFFIKE